MVWCVCVCVLFLDGQQCISEPGDNEVLVDCTAMSRQGFIRVCLFVQTGHGLLLFIEPCAAPQTVVITCGGPVSLCCYAFTLLYTVSMPAFFLLSDQAPIDETF